jgi:putative FmdB family regulatory protein
MPVYTYQCDSCGVRFERQQKFTDQPLTRCPECAKKSLRKVYTPVGIVFKGSGFYATDHRSPSGNSRAKETAKTDGEDNLAAKEPAKETKESSTKVETAPKKD